MLVKWFWNNRGKGILVATILFFGILGLYGWFQFYQPTKPPSTMAKKIYPERAYQSISQDEMLKNRITVF
jgi:predicted negative regulator of RcsB-dependent stress response